MCLVSGASYGCCFDLVCGMCENVYALSKQNGREAYLPAGMLMTGTLREAQGFLITAFVFSEIPGVVS